MIKFSLKCTQDHRFDSWFQSAEAYDKLVGRGLIACAVCGDTGIAKSIMAPNVRPGSADTPRRVPSAARPLSTPSGPAEAAMAELRRRIDANSEYVGTEFAAQARGMHAGGAPARSIHGEARPAEARKLMEEGVPILPLPFRPARKVN